jgi:DNA-directed RNA polymerase subunit RPC12/RpoP
VKAQGQVSGSILIVAGLILGGAILAWLISGLQDDKLDRPAAIFGIVLTLGVVVLPMVGGGIYFLHAGTKEARQLAAVDKQRRLLSAIQARGQVSITDLVLDLDSTRDQIQADLHDLVGKGIFTGYIDWSSGMLYSVEARSLQGRTECPNCGGRLELAGKGLIKCPYCGAEIFLG